MIDDDRIHAAIAAIIDERRGKFEKQMMRFRGNARQILVAIAKNSPIKHPKEKDFLTLIQTLASTSVFKIIRELEQNAGIYQTVVGYVMADLLLAIYLRRYH